MCVCVVVFPVMLGCVDVTTYDYDCDCDYDCGDEAGRHGWGVYWTYFAYCGRLRGALPVVLFLIAVQVGC